MNLRGLLCALIFECVRRTINIGGKATLLMGAGDRIVIHTPGGGGWGAKLPSKVPVSNGNPGGAHVNHHRGSLAERKAMQLGV
jgi:N-methylhydantoinase B/oxoprolinase/acetone carboxylase alpha subunit